MDQLCNEDRLSEFDDIHSTATDLNEIEPADLDFGGHELADILLAERVLDNNFGRFLTQKWFLRS